LHSASASGMRLRRETVWQVLGFDCGSVQSWQQRYGWVRRVIQVPYWLVLLVPLSALAVVTRRHRRYARLASGCCVACGYDLRATPRRCPECGAVPTGPRV
jgi:hypothetical protein